MGADTLLQMSEPFLVDTTRTLVPVGGWPDMIYDGTQYFVVWGEHRAGAYEVFGLRIAKDGTLIDSVPIVIKAGNTHKGNAVVGWNGSEYLVCWEEELYEGDYYRIMGARVTKDGVVLDPGGIDISRNGKCKSASVASDGKDFFVVWEDQRNGTRDIYGARIGSSGEVVDNEGIKIAENTRTNSGYPDVIFGNGCYYAVWSRYGGDIRGKKIFLDGSVDSINIIQDAGGYFPSIAYSGSNYLVSWVNGADEAYVKRLDLSGNPIDSISTRISPDTGKGYVSKVIFDGENYAVVWGNNFIKVDTSGNPIDSTYHKLSVGVGLLPWGQPPGIGYSGDNYLILGTGLDGVRISKSGQVLDATPIHYSYAGNEQESPAVAFNGWEYLIAYATDKGEGTGKDIYAVRISQYGERIGEPIPVCTDSGKQADLRLRVSSAEKNFLVVWDDDGNIFGRIIEEDGTESSSVFMINSPEYTDNNQPAIASDGKRYLVIWYSGGYLVGRFIESDGRLGNTIDLAKAGWDGHCDIIYDGEAYFIVYDTYDYPNSNVRGIRLSREGGGLSSGWIASNDNYQESYPVVVYNGKEYFVIWADYRNWDTTRTDIYGVWVDKECRALSSDVKISDDVSLEYPRAGVRVGDNILISWSRGNSLYSAIIKRDNIGSPFQLDTLGGCGEVLFCEGNENTAFMVYSAFAGNPYCNRRVWGKFVRSVREYNLPLTELGVYPSINNGMFQVRFNGWEEGKTDIKMYDIMGRQVRDFKNIDIINGINKIDIDVRSIQTGKYFIYVSNSRDRCSTPVIILK